MLSHVVGNSATATSASKCTGNSATASKLQTARNIKLQGAVAGNTNFDGSGNITITTTQNNIFVLSGNITLSNGYATTNINYPSGLNADNCIVVSFLARSTTLESGIKYGYGYLETPTGYLSGAIGHNISLRTPNILLQVNNPVDHSNGNTTYNYKIILMKIS